MFDWLNGPGAELKHHTPGTTNYVTQLRNRRGGQASSESSSRRDDADSEDDFGSKQPFPLNQQFVSEPILSEELSNEIYKRVAQQKKSVRSVSVELRVDMRRVGAVVRLKELEKRMKNEVCFFFCPCLLHHPLSNLYCNDEYKSISLQDPGFPSTVMVTNSQKLQLSEAITYLPVIYQCVIW
jgi:hypothetical protein